MKPLSVRHLDVAYGAQPALRDVSLEVSAGSLTALLGPSGCGKTSLLRAVAGFVAPQAGEIRIDGQDIAPIPPRRRNLGVVFQSYALFPHLSARANVRFGLDSRGIPAAEASRRAEAALALVGLAELAARRPRQLSGGQQQRVALARALVIEPDILLLDEPLGALDRRLRLHMQTELKALQQRLGVTTLLVTHDQEEALALADQVAVMRDGRIAQVDTPAAIFRRPRTAWVAGFIGAGSVLAASAARGVVRFEVAPPDAATLFLPADRLHLLPAPADAVLRVTALRYLGHQCEVHVAGGSAELRALLPADEAAALQPGVAVSAVVPAGGWHRLDEDLQGSMP